MPRALCAGHINWSVILQVDVLPGPDDEAHIVDQRRCGGGSAANAAVTLTGLGVPTGLVGSVGDDEHGMYLRDALDGLKTVRGAETPSSTLS